MSTDRDTGDFEHDTLHLSSNDGFSITLEQYRKLMTGDFAVGELMKSEESAESYDLHVNSAGLNVDLDIIECTQTALDGRDVGVGLLAMQNIEKDQCLGIYMGEVCKEDSKTDTDYTTALKKGYCVDSRCLEHGLHRINDSAGLTNVVAQSCIVHVSDSGRVINMPLVIYFSSKKITKFQFLSVAYGDQYWTCRGRLMLWPISMPKIRESVTREEAVAAIDACTQ
ncbi:putative histone-lysine N-methyltransferase, H3 lysine-9 specific [Carpediemonas membranifera]|uniref:Putative histone-lysine N-methyltransferase, H3 lysine-9 specific n=1 Tax=Carpediemonas membranifera TaxID=201153 RepID=A0A8J6BVC5_9EUKA|nr:putative histone-lysine N-methyltransferase, H3 lysine-9 specific [Carpediemonas membranifera]|eukprot:KAG9391281.1 putative histone-lysine N-methyltransferase, H3 lysine-9 specific [Carpediemonas membranifera]